MTLPFRTAAALGLLTLVLAMQPAASRANCPTLGAQQVCYDQPAVNAQTTNTGFSFPAGSRVALQADGCEQTGGSGATWKRYVNPDPPNGSSTYHGHVGIYSSVGGPATLPNTRWSSVSQGALMRVTTQSFLQVGFEDDDYSDNNYGGHDNGTNNQCAWNFAGPIGPGSLYNSQFGYSGPAYILMTIIPNAAPAITAKAPPDPPGFVGGTTSLGVQSYSDPESDPVTFRYLIDDVNVSGTTSATSFSWNSTTVADGSHTLKITAVDSYGASHTSDGVAVKVDNTNPTVTITGGPNNQTFGADSTLTWNFTAADGPGSGIKTVQCRMDGVPVACTTGGSYTASSLPDGSHTFSVQATDNLNHVSGTDSRTIAVDATPPDTTVTSGPVEGGSTTDTSVTYAFSSSEQNSTFECQVYLDRPAPIKPGFAACAGGSVDLITGLAPGAYVFEVRATDAYHNTDPTPAVRHFTVTTAQAQPQPGQPGGGSAPVGPSQSPRLRAKVPATITYAYSSALKLTKLQVRNIPKGSTLRVTCKGKGCPRALRKPYVKRRAHGRVSLARLIKRPFGAGDVLSFRITNPDWQPVTKTLRFRANKAPVAR